MLAEKIQLENDEKILAQVRKHWFVFFAQILTIVVAAIAPLFLSIFISKSVNSGAFAFDISPYTPHITFIYATWLLFLWAGLFSSWTNYYLDIWTITNRRLIAVDQRGFFRRSTASFRLERLQDMNVEINGIIATFLDFGTLEAKTAGHEGDEFKVYGLPHPRELKAIILEAADQLIDHPESPYPIAGTGV